jgi:hypothetical protein
LAAEEEMAEQSAQHLIDRLPDAAAALNPQTAGRKRGRPRWVIAGAVLAALAALAFFVRRAFAPGIEVEEEELLGDTGTHPAAGAGTGWPEPPRTPEHTEPITRSNGASAVPPLAERPAVAGGERATVPPSVDSQLESPAATGSPGALDTAAPGDEPGAGPEAQLPSEDATLPFPAQRPPVPVVEAQADVNVRLQSRQDALYAAFPGMTRQDIVECDGDLDRLAIILSMRTGTAVEDVRGHLNAILAAEPAGEAK